MRKIAVTLLASMLMVAMGCRYSPHPPERPVHRYGIDVYDDAVVIHTIVDGLDKRAYLFGDPQNLATFKLRTDGYKHTSVQLIGGKEGLDNYGSVVVLVPTADDVEEWRTWFTEAIATAKERASQAPQREYPSRVLPPK